MTMSRSSQTKRQALSCIVGSDRKKETLKAWYKGLTEGQREAIESVSMDM